MFANFEVGRLKRKKEEDGSLGNFLYVIEAVYFTYFESFYCV